MLFFISKGGIYVQIDFGKIKSVLKFHTLKPLKIHANISATEKPFA